MGLRIGVNALYLIPGGVGGTEVYLRQLLRALSRTDPANEYFVLTNKESIDLVPDAPNMRALPQPIAARIRPARIAWEQVAVPAVTARHGLDVMLNPGFTSPLVCPCPQVTVFHDLQHKRHPEYFRWYDLPFWNLLLYGSAVRSTRLIAVSEATRLDLLRYYGKDATVIGHGVEPQVFAIAARRRPEQFLLCVSTLHPHKGIETLVDAFAIFHEVRPEFRLVLAGMRGFAGEAIEERIRAAGLSNVVTLTGWIDREPLYELYARAWAFVYPSRFEGFGMPVAEAMAAGVSVACSDIEPLRSVAGGGALLFPAGEVSALAEALQRIVDDEGLRSRLMTRARERSVEFTWESTAHATRSVLEQAAQGR